MSTPRRDSRKYGTSTVRVRDLKVCHYCGTSPLPESSVYCPSCGFPQRGTEQEQKRFLIGRRNAGTEVNEAEAGIGIARLILFGLGILHGGIAAYIYFNIPGSTWIGLGAVGAVYVGLGFWGGKKPYPALLSGFIVYVTYLLVITALAPETIFSGLVLKIGIIAGLLAGMRSVKKAEELKKNLDVKKLDLAEDSAAHAGGEEKAGPSTE